MRVRAAAVAAMGTAAAAWPAPAADPQAAAFRLWFGGVPAGVVETSLERDGAAYAFAARGTPARWLSLLFSAELRAEGEGELPRPRRFLAVVAFGDDRQRVEVRRDADGRPAVSAEPPFRPRPWQIDPASQGDAGDPVSVAAALLTPAPAAARCGATWDVFDGRRRSRLALGPAERTEAGGWRCRGSWSRIAGWRESDLEAEPVTVAAEFSEGGDGLARLVRIEVRTRWGVGVAAR